MKDLEGESTVFELECGDESSFSLNRTSIIRPAHTHPGRRPHDGRGHDDDGEAPSFETQEGSSDQLFNHESFFRSESGVNPRHSPPSFPFFIHNFYTFLFNSGG